MSTCKILDNNAADRAALAVPGTAPGMGAGNLQTDVRGQVCRVLASAATITAAWDSSESIGSIVVIGASTTIRVRVYADTAGTDLLHDTGEQPALPGDDSYPTDINAYAYGLLPLMALHLPVHYSAQRVVIDLTAPGAVHIDLSRLIIGPTVDLRYSAQYGVRAGVVDMSVHSRAASGDLRTDLGPRARSLTFDLARIHEADRPAVRRIIDRGIGRWLYVSLVAGYDDPVTERDHSIYGKPMVPAALAWSATRRFATAFEIEGF